MGTKVNKDNLEELYIEKAALLAGLEAPVSIDTQRARRFVHDALRPRKQRPFYAWGFAGALVFASLSLVLVLYRGHQKTGYDIIPAMESIHASLDSLKTDSDSLLVKDEIIEINATVHE